MNIKIRDRDVLKDIQPEQVISYLKAKGWQEQRQLSDKGGLWILQLPPDQDQQPSDQEEYELLVPYRPLADYVARITDTVDALEVIEKRSQLDILQDLKPGEYGSIRVKIRDEEVLRSIEPEQLVAYLRAKGWSEDRKHSDKGALWIDSSQEYELLVPYRPDLSDYVSRIIDIVDALEVIEDRSQLEILHDLKEANGKSQALMREKPRVDVENTENWASSLSRRLSGTFTGLPITQKLKTLSDDPNSNDPNQLQKNHWLTLIELLSLSTSLLVIFFNAYILLGPTRPPELRYNDDHPGLLSPVPETPLPLLMLPPPTPPENLDVLLTSEYAIILVESWLRAKEQAFGPSLNPQILSEYTTRIFFQRSINAVNWLRQNNGYYTYGEFSVEPLSQVSIRGTQATIDLRINEDITLIINGRIDPDQTGTVSGTYRFTLELDNGRWKISDIDEIGEPRLIW